MRAKGTTKWSYDYVVNKSQLLRVMARAFDKSGNFTKEPATQLSGHGPLRSKFVGQMHRCLAMVVENHSETDKEARQHARNKNDRQRK